MRYHGNVFTYPVSGNRPTLHSCCLFQGCTIKMGNRESLFGKATRYGLEDPGMESRWVEIFRTYPDRLRGPPSLLYNGYRVFPGGKGGRGVMLITNPLLVPRLRKSWAITQLTPWVLLGLLRGSLYSFTIKMLVIEYPGQAGVPSTSHFNHDPQTKLPKRGTSCRSQYFQEHGRIALMTSPLLCKSTHSNSYRRYGSCASQKLSWNTPTWQTQSQIWRRFAA
jgi:hypothetical protein